MTKQLRKRHLYIWTVLSILLPGVIIVGQLVIPKEVKQSLLQPQKAASLPLTIRKTESLNYTLYLRSNDDSTQLQLEWVNKAVLPYPTATIYAVNDATANVKAGKIIGRIEARGTYDFKLDSSFRQLLHTKGLFILYDFIHEQVIDTLNL